ncbi:TPA: hypothetical protein RQL27_000997 [Vibrio vulnificus]|uniref:hypothetical protein n=1 Tax=Vibrio vulnificus TaxID=672 RepID=UPI000A207B41|nr:hypothetical protein [Vibrio vulnificus]ARN67639.1 hypothetical protein FORC36_3122 [Vibrio vulnificus]EID4424841.1 hypothetical protein [Vibrio vulnificus]EJU9788233.1 hypothetical protein [Vibrio vulnificus]ELX8647057.1 hypothetical protein [Vibrio vulnificus]MCA3988654.1 hypothetical protein [Vibrio vulnificus]
MMRLLLILLLFSSQSFALVLPVVVEEKVLKDYQAFVNDRDPLTIGDFTGPKARRSTVEIVLLQQAFMLGGVPVTLEFHTAPVAERIRRMSMLPDYAMAANTIWDSAVGGDGDRLWVSDAVIRQGEFEAGLYTVSTREDLLNAQQPIHIDQLSAVSSSQWVSDWNTLQALPLSNLLNVADWGNMVDMVGRHRVDFLLAPFQVSDDLSFTTRGFQFYPIPKVKIGLTGSRHFILSRQFPESEKLAQALNQGIAILRQKGTIERALIECGFINTKVSSWSKIN